MTIRMAVVGVGALGQHHARILAGLEGVELVGVVDSSEARGQEIAQRLETQWFSGIEPLFELVDAVSIVVPTVAHLTVAAEFLQRGIPVLVEKPLAASLQEAAKLVSLAETHGTLLQVGHIERFNPATAQAWKLSGEPKYIRAERVSPYTFRSTDIGVVHDLMIHDIDLVLSQVSAPVRAVTAFGISVFGRHEDCANARIVFENGCIADLTASRVCPQASRKMQLWSGKGCVTVDFTSRNVTSFSPSETMLYGTPVLERAAQSGADLNQLKQDVFGKFLKVNSLEVPAADALTAELSQFIECIQTGKIPDCDGAAGLRAMRVADQVLKSLQSHQWDGHAAGPVGPMVLESPSTPKRAAG